MIAEDLRAAAPTISPRGSCGIAPVRLRVFADAVDAFVEQRLGVSP